MSFIEFLSNTTMADRRVSRSQNYLKQRANFTTNGYQLIYELLELSREPAVPPQMVDEALHSIFFLGKINQFSPEIIFAHDQELREAFNQTYPQALELCSSQLPKRHPMSCVLDIIIRVRGQNNEDAIKEKLQQLSKRLPRDRKVKFLRSTTMCVCQNTEIPESVRYYGVSMSTSGGRSRDIMVAASCFTHWDGHVADAVMTYYPEMVRRNDFDGTIRLPENVRCQAFTVSTGEEIPPCVSCGHLFGLRTAETQAFNYGNCAEVESVSNLFKNERGIKEQSQLRGDAFAPENRQKARRSALCRLRASLRDVGFNWDNRFYPNLHYDI